MENPKTITYSQIQGLEIKVDLFLPPDLPPGSHPSFVFIHGGGMVSGNREGLASMRWLIDTCATHSIPFLSADHRLIHPSTGFDIIEDAKTLMSFLGSASFSTHLPSNTSLDPGRIAVTGESGGGYMAYAAALYADPRPCALLQQYAMGGNLLLDHWIKPNDVACPGRNVSGQRVRRLMDEGVVVADDPLGGYAPNRDPRDDSGRLGLWARWVKAGEVADYVLGVKGLGKSLARFGSVGEREENLPRELRGAVLHLNVEGEVPPMLLVHGVEDELVPVEESRTMHERWLACGGKSELVAVEGAGHALRTPGTMGEWMDGIEKMRGKMARWLLEQLQVKD